MLQSETTGLQTLVSLKKDYEARLDEKFPLHCADCGSKNVNRASSVAEPNTKSNTTTKNSEQPTSTEAALADLYKSKIN